MAFLDPLKQNFAEVICPKSKTKYVVQDCYSMLTSCDLLVGYESKYVQTSMQGFDVQRAPRSIHHSATWDLARSQYEGLKSNKNIEMFRDNTHLSVDNYDVELQAKEDPMLESTFNQRNVCVEKSIEAWMQIERMISQSDSITHITLA